MDHIIVSCTIESSYICVNELFKTDAVYQSFFSLLDKPTAIINTVKQGYNYFTNHM